MKYLQTYESHSIEWKYIGSCDYEFDIDDIIYLVSFSGKEGSVNVEFRSMNDDGGWDFRNLDRSNPFKTMRTITDIIKDFIEKNPKVNKIKFFGSEDKSSTPGWIIDLITSNQFVYFLATYLDSILTTPKQWLSNPSRRTKMFNRWVDKETKNINWSTKRIGNQIQLIKNK